MSVLNNYFNGKKFDINSIFMHQQKQNLSNLSKNNQTKITSNIIPDANEVISNVINDSNISNIDKIKTLQQFIEFGNYSEQDKNLFSNAIDNISLSKTFEEQDIFEDENFEIEDFSKLLRNEKEEKLSNAQGVLNNLQNFEIKDQESLNNFFLGENGLSSIYPSIGYEYGGGDLNEITAQYTNSDGTVDWASLNENLHKQYKDLDQDLMKNPDLLELQSDGSEITEQRNKTEEFLNNAFKDNVNDLRANRLIGQSFDIYNNFLTDPELQKNEAVNKGLTIGKSYTRQIPGKTGILGTMILGALETIGNTSISKVREFYKDKELATKQEASYEGTYNDKINQAAENSGKKFDLWSRHKVKDLNKLSKKADVLQSHIAAINNRNEDFNALKATAGNYEIGRQARLNALENEYNRLAVSAKYGSILKIINNSKKINQSLPEFKSGGTLEGYLLQEPFSCITEPFEYTKISDWGYQDVDSRVEFFKKGGEFNIIPEGALHARKHNMDIEGITKKGIPVVSESEDGKLEQQAEIEHSEIIFRLEITDAIDEARKKYDEETSQKEKNKIAIEIGKLLTKEILYNTDDRTNLINTI